MTKFTKKDLKKGDILVLRNGQKLEYPQDRWTFGLTYELLNEDLTNNGMQGNLCDVVKVLRNPKYEIAFERKEILDETEKAYLKAIIKPKNIKENIEYIVKSENNFLCKEYIDITLNDNDSICLPYFKKNTMYKGMKLNKKYTLKELGLED